MSIHNIQKKLEGPRAFSTNFSGFSGPEGLCFGFGKTAGNGIEGWAPGALFIDTDSNIQYRNTGSSTTATWTNDGTDTATELTLTADASATTAVETITHGGTGATGWLGATGVGMLSIACDGNLAHANASCMLIAYSGTGAASGMGTSLRITDTGATATSFAVYISAATGEALKVDSGEVTIDETLNLDAGIKFVTSEFTIVDTDGTTLTLEGGAANDTLAIGTTIATDVLFNGATAGADCQWDASGNSLKFNGTAALVLPQGTGSGGSLTQEVTGSLFYETDAKKLWVYDGAGWVGVAVA